MPDGYYLTVEQAADRAGVSVSTLKRYTRSGEIWPQRITRPDAVGCILRYSDKDVERARQTYAHNLTWLPMGLRTYLEDRKKHPMIAQAQDRARRS